MKVRKKPVVVEAREWNGSWKSANEIMNWIRATGTRRAWYEKPAEGPVLVIRTLEGMMTASPGDFIILGVAGEHYPCKPDIFWETYERVEDEA